MVLPCDDNWEIPRENINLLEVIGEGAFGQVLKAEAFDITRLKTGVTIVAVKTLKGLYSKMSACTLPHKF